jgi:hypothetical protein
MTSASTRFFGQPRLTRLTLYLLALLLFKGVPPQRGAKPGNIDAKFSSNIQGDISQNRPRKKGFLWGGGRVNSAIQKETPLFQITKMILSKQFKNKGYLIIILISRTSSLNPPCA